MTARRPLVLVNGQRKQLPTGDTLVGVVQDTDPRLTDAREWTAPTVTQAEAEQGTATTRRAWTAQRVFQAIAAWWAASAAKTKLDGIATGATANATDAQLRDRATHTGTQAISTVSGLQTALDNKINTSERGVSGGIPTLDQFARIPASQLPSYVDDVLEFATTAQFPATGEGGKIYIAINQGTAANPTRQYRWTGSVYAEINPSPGTTDALAEGSTNLYFSEHRVRNTVLTGLSFASSAAVAATDSVLAAFGKIQARLNLLGTAANVNVQTSPTDTTAGAVATTDGARFAVLANFGNYYSGSAGKNIDTLVGGESGLFSTSNPGTFPPDFGSFVYIETQQTYSASSVVQEACDYGGSSVPLGRRAFRVRSNGGEWSAWHVYCHSGNFNPATKADLASPTFTGDPKAPTPAAGDNDTSIATTAFVRAAMALFGVGASGGVAPSDDLNLITAGGFYNVNTNTLNKPQVSSGSSCIHTQYAVGYAQQLVMSRTNDRVYFRRCNAGTWSAWQEIWHTGNFDPAAKQDKSAVIGTATTRTLALADAWNYVRPGTTSAITLTVPTNASVAFDVGTEITVRALGNITLAAASGVTLNAPSGGTLNMTARMTVTLKKVATDEWDVIGQTVAA